MSYPTTPCIKTLEFSYDWSATESTTAIAQSYECGLDFCTFGVKHFTTYLTFTLAPMTTFVHSYTIKTPSGSCLASGSLVPREPGLHSMESIKKKVDIHTCIGASRSFSNTYVYIYTFVHLQI